MLTANAIVWISGGRPGDSSLGALGPDGLERISEQRLLEGLACLAKRLYNDADLILGHGVGLRHSAVKDVPVGMFDHPVILYPFPLSRLSAYSPACIDAL